MEAVEEGEDEKEVGEDEDGKAAVREVVGESEDEKEAGGRMNVIWRRWGNVMIIKRE